MWPWFLTLTLANDIVVDNKGLTTKNTHMKFEAYHSCSFWLRFWLAKYCSVLGLYVLYLQNIIIQHGISQKYKAPEIIYFISKTTNSFDNKYRRYISKNVCKRSCQYNDNTCTILIVYPTKYRPHL